MGEKRDLHSPSSGKMRLPDGTILDLSDFINDAITKNIANNIRALKVDTQSIESSHAKIITQEKTDYELIAPGSGNKIIIQDVFLAAEGNIGPVEIDFDNGGDPIARLYSSQFNRASFSNLTLRGGTDEKVVFTGGDTEDEVFVVINYIEIEG